MSLSDLPRADLESEIVRLRARVHELEAAAPGSSIETSPAYRQTVDALQSSEERFRTLLEQIDVGVVMLGPTSEILLSNPAGRRLLGLTPSQLHGRTIDDRTWDSIHEDGTPFETAAYPVPLAIATRRTVRDVVMGVARPSLRDRVWLQVTAIPLFDADGTLAQVLCHFTDVTERKRTEELRRDLEAKIQQTQKYQSLAVLAGGLAHDFNNLLVGILGNARLTLRQLPTESPCRPVVRKIEETGLRAAELVRQMLAYSGKGRFVVQPLDLTAVVRSMASLFEPMVPKFTLLRHDLTERLPSVRADAEQLRQLVLNLLANAVEALSRHGGTITIRTGQRQCDRAYLATTRLADGLTEGTYVVLEVEDTGCGMDQATQARIFDPFFSTKFTGRGLGLAAVLGIVRGHQATIRVNSAPGRGTTMTVCFPCVDVAAMPTVPPTETLPATEPSRQDRSRKTILVIDDEEVVRSVIRNLLEHAGYSVATAAGARDGLELLHRGGQEIALVMLDVTMPEMGGLDCFGLIRALRPTLPVLLMSGYVLEELSAQFIGLDLSGFVQKPFRVDDLLSQVAELVRA